MPYTTFERDSRGRMREVRHRGDRPSHDSFQSPAHSFQSLPEIFQSPPDNIGSLTGSFRSPPESRRSYDSGMRPSRSDLVSLQLSLHREDYVPALFTPIGGNRPTDEYLVSVRDLGTSKVLREKANEILHHRLGSNRSIRITWPSVDNFQVYIFWLVNKAWPGESGKLSGCILLSRKVKDDAFCAVAISALVKAVLMYSGDDLEDGLEQLESKPVEIWGIDGARNMSSRQYVVSVIAEHATEQDVATMLRLRAEFPRDLLRLLEETQHRRGGYRSRASTAASSSSSSHAPGSSRFSSLAPSTADEEDEQYVQALRESLRDMRLQERRQAAPTIPHAPSVAPNRSGVRDGPEENIEQIMSMEQAEQVAIDRAIALSLQEKCIHESSRLSQGAHTNLPNPNTTTNGPIPAATSLAPTSGGPAPLQIAPPSVVVNIAPVPASGASVPSPSATVPVTSGPAPVTGASAALSGVPAHETSTPGQQPNVATPRPSAPTAKLTTLTPKLSTLSAKPSDPASQLSAPGPAKNSSGLTPIVPSPPANQSGPARSAVDNVFNPHIPGSFNTPKSVSSQSGPARSSLNALLNAPTSASGELVPAPSALNTIIYAPTPAPGETETATLASHPIVTNTLAPASGQQEPQDPVSNAQTSAIPTAVGKKAARAQKRANRGKPMPASTLFGAEIEDSNVDSVTTGPRFPWVTVIITCLAALLVAVVLKYLLTKYLGGQRSEVTDLGFLK